MLRREGDGYVATCPELDVTSQGDTIEQARENLQEAVELFLEVAGPEEVGELTSSEFYVTSLEVNVA